MSRANNLLVDRNDDRGDDKHKRFKFQISQAANETKTWETRRRSRKKPRILHDAESSVIARS